MATPCTAQELVTAASCFHCKTDGLEAVEIYLLCVVANGGVPPPMPGIVLGNPDEDWMFGDPNSGIIFGVP